MPGGTVLATYELRDRCCPALIQGLAMPAGSTTNDSPCSSQALVVAASTAHDAAPHRPVQRATAFLAHLIATTRHAPQTRQRRRAEPAEVIAAYRATIARLQDLNDQ
jgi:hypothetical protein